MHSLILPKNKGRVSGLIKEINKIEEEAISEYDIILERYLGKKDDIRKYRSTFLRWRDERQKVIALVKTGKYKQAEQMLLASGCHTSANIQKDAFRITLFAENMANKFSANAMAESRKFIYFALIVFSLTVVLAILIFLFINSSFIKPIFHAVIFADSIRKGERPESLSTERTDEIGNLFNSLNSMYAGILSRKAEIERVNASLEEKIKERTRDLDSTNQHLRATEQQLRAMNQQLMASEQQMRAMNQQLTAKNQQLASSEQTLLSAKMEWERTFDSLESIIFITSPDHRIQKINQKGCDFLGLPRNEIIGQKCRKLFNPENPDFVCPCQKMDPYNETFSHIEINFDDRLFNLSAYPVKTDEKTVSVCYVLTDITDDRNNAIEKEQLQKQLFQTSKLAAIGELAAGIGHEINNPLAIINGYVDMLFESLNEMNDPGFAMHLRNMDKIKYSIDRISEIIKSLKTFARPESTDENMLVDIESEIRKSIEFAGIIYKNTQIDIMYEKKCNNPKISGSSGKIQQILMNLFSNAKDALYMSDQKNILMVLPGFLWNAQHKAA